MQRWPRTGRSRDPLRRWAQLARIRPYGGKSHPKSLNPASEWLLEQVLTLLSLTGRFSLSWLLMPPCSLLQVGGCRRSGRSWRSQGTSSLVADTTGCLLQRARSLSPAPSLPFQWYSSMPLHPNKESQSQLAAICSIPSFFVCLPPWQPLSCVFPFGILCFSLRWSYEASSSLLQLPAARAAPIFLSAS